MVGSLVYSKNFSEKSDIDLLIFGDIKGWEKLCFDFYEGDEENFFKETIELYKKGEVQYFCLKFKFKGIIYSVDFFLKSFLKNFALDLNNNKLYFKITNKPQTNFYNQGCNNKRLIIPKINHKFNYGYSVSSPQYTINGSNYYLGILFDKILTGYIIISEINNFNEKFQHSIFKYIFFIKKKNNFKSNQFILNSLNRFERFNKEHKIERLNYFNDISKKFK